jgi:hypothetical protein
MGGMISAYFSEYLSEKEKVKVKCIITIASPFGSSPIVNHCICCFQGEKRTLQMSKESEFRRDLCIKMKESENNYKRMYYNIGSTIDLLVPSPNSNISISRNRIKNFNYLGHNGLVIFPSVWKFINLILDEKYSNLDEIV